MMTVVHLHCIIDYYLKRITARTVIQPRLSPVWLSWLGVVLQSESSPVRFLVGAHTWVVGLVRG